MSNLKKLTILHSNDMHGDFLAEKIDEKLVGGVSMLSGYVNKVRNETDNVIYAVAGDMFRGSVIDSEYKGISTIDIMNMLSPDVVCIGNHELDYGLEHLLFLEKCASFPIINANLYITSVGSHLFTPYKIFNVGGMKVLFVGLITEAVMNSAKNDSILSSYICLEDAAKEAGRVLNSIKTDDIDITILLTHIGIDEDRKLASGLSQDSGVDIIIGGHTHTWLEKPEEVNNILIVQAGTGTDCIGRFDITVDCDTNSIADYKWELIPINDSTCPRDGLTEERILSYKEKTDIIYSRIITRFPAELSHPARYGETQIGNLFAEAMRSVLGTDIVLLGSGSIRKPTLGPAVTLENLREIFPFSDKVYEITLTGIQLKTAVCNMICDEMYCSHTEFYQVSKNVHIVYDMKENRIVTFEINGRNVDDGDRFTVAMQGFHFDNIDAFLGIPKNDIIGGDNPKCLSSCDFDVIYEYLQNNPHINSRIEGRIQILNEN